MKVKNYHKQYEQLQDELFNKVEAEIQKYSLNRLKQEKIVCTTDWQRIKKKDRTMKIEKLIKTYYRLLEIK